MHAKAEEIAEEIRGPQPLARQEEGPPAQHQQMSQLTIGGLLQTLGIPNAYYMQIMILLTKKQVTLSEHISKIRYTRIVQAHSSFGFEYFKRK